MKKILAIILCGLIAVNAIAQASVVNSSVNLSIANNADGWQAGGGTTVRTLTITGSNHTLGTNSDQTATGTFTYPGASDTLAGIATAQTWSALNKFTNADFSILGSSTGYTLLESGLSSTSNNTLTLPTESSDTLVDLTGTQTLTNKTITSTTNTLGGVTMTLGSDATGDIYYRNSSNHLTRLAIGSNGNFLTVSSGLPAWGTTSASYAPMPTTVVTGSTQSMTTNNAYFANDGSTLVTFTLPTSSTVGDEVIVGGISSGGWKLAQNASDEIYFGSAATTSGTGGYLSSNNAYDTVHLKCVVTNTTWIVVGSQGNITVN
jgi:hypothetical protein